MALIGDYQHGPQLAAQAGGRPRTGAGDEATFGSHTALSAPHAPATRRWLAAPPHRAAGPSLPLRAAGPARRRKRHWLSVAGLTGAAVALVAVGAVIALALDGGSGGPSPALLAQPGSARLPPPTGPPPSSFAPLSGTPAGDRNDPADQATVTPGSWCTAPAGRRTAPSRWR